MITAGSCNAIQASAPIIMLQDPPPKAFQRIRHSKSLARHTQQHRRCCLRTPPCAVATQGTARPETRSSTGSQDTEVIVIGSGIGGLSCAAMLANYGVKVLVLESHDIPGGAAHSWVQKGYHFESGPSLYSDMASRGRAANPLAHVLQAIDEPLELIEYNTWNILVPEGDYLTEVGNDQFESVLQKIRGPEAVQQWRHLQTSMRPLAKAATMLPPTAFRFDPGAAITVFARYLPQILTGGTDGLKLLGSFKKILDDDGTITDPFIRNYLDLLCFLLSGLPSDGTIAAEVAFMFNPITNLFHPKMACVMQTWFKPGAMLEFPKGGSQSLVNALVRGVKKNGGKILLRSHVDRILIEGGRATGVVLKDGKTIRASKAVVSNASMWNTLDLVPPEHVPASYRKQVDTTPLNRSFMHLHLGFDGAGLPEDLELHHIVVNSWEPAVDSEQNVVLISIPSVKDPNLAPKGKHTLHAYLPATEPFAIWKDLERGSPEYEELKKERSAVMWRAVERIIPDIRQRCEVTLVGTPLTHRHFLRRHAGTYGPGIKAGEGTFPGPKSPIPGLLCCGDSTFPGIGLPAVAASGAVAANSLVSPWKHWQMLDSINA